MEVNTQYKDSVFRLLFGRDTKEARQNALDLYNALANTDYDDPTEIEITTIEDALYFKHKNDSSMLFKDVISLWEEQSTYDPNMPIRGLEYFSQVYSKYIAKSHVNIYSTKLRPLPTPRYFVFYIGKQEQPERTILKLSDAFSDKENPALEVKATMLNINKGKNKKIPDRCKALKEYTELVSKVRKYKTDNVSLKDAVDAAVDECIRENILKEFLIQHRAEVKEMFALEFHEDVFRKDILEEGRAEGRKESENSMFNLVKSLRGAGRESEIADIFSSPEKYEEELSRYGLG